MFFCAIIMTLHFTFELSRSLSCAYLISDCRGRSGPWRMHGICIFLDEVSQALSPLLSFYFYMAKYVIYVDLSEGPEMSECVSISSLEALV